MSFHSSFDASEENTPQNVSTMENSKIIQSEPKINKSLLSALAKVLNQVINENKLLKNYNRKIKEQASMTFSARLPPEISLFDYLYRIKYYGEMEDNTLIIALILIDRLCDITGLTLTPYNIHRILFGSILVSVKYNEDLFYDNNYYSSIAGVGLKKLNQIEEEFVDMMEFNLYVERNHFEKYLRYLSTIESKKE